MANKKPNILTTTIIVLIFILIVSIGTIFVVTQSAIVEDFKMYDSFSADNINLNCVEYFYDSPIHMKGHDYSRITCNNDMWKSHTQCQYGCGYDSIRWVTENGMAHGSSHTYVYNYFSDYTPEIFHKLSPTKNFMSMFVVIKGTSTNDLIYRSKTTFKYGTFLKICIDGFCHEPTTEGEWIYTIIPSILNPDKYTFYVNDRPILNGTYDAFLNIDMYGSENSKWDYIKYKVPFGSCSFGDNRILGMQTFVGAEGGREITEDDLIFQPLQYCINHPVLITTPDGSEPTSEPYILLSKGGSFTLKEDQTALFFYTFYNDGSIPQVCTDGQFYDADNKECRTIGGVIILCTEGTFDPILGSCTVQPEVQYICNESQRYNTVSRVCEEIMPVRKIPAEECKGELVPTDEGFDCYIALEDVYECEGTIEIINDVKVCIIPLATIYEECAGNIVEVDGVPECRIDLEDVFDCEGTIKSVNNINICVTEVVTEIEYVPEDCDGTLVEQDDGTFICKTQPKEVYECVKGTLIDGQCIILIEDSIVERLYSNTPIMLFIGGLSLVIIVLVMLLIIKKKKR